MNFRQNIGIASPKQVCMPNCMFFMYIAKDLISKMLVVDPKKRFTTTDVLKHPWISVCVAINRCIWKRLHSRRISRNRITNYRNSKTR